MFCDLLKHSSGHWIPKVSWSFINTIHTDTAYSRGITRSQNLLLFSSPRMLWTYGSCDKSLLLCTLTWRSSGFLEREIPNPVPEKRKTHLNGPWIINTLSEQQLSGWSIGTHVVYVVQLQYWRSRVDNILNGRRRDGCSVTWDTNRIASHSANTVDPSNRPYRGGENLIIYSRKDHSR